MKRGLITWDKAELAPAAFERRFERVRSVLIERELPALVVYSELWRSNQGRFFSNYMPYFNRALLVLPLEQAPTLLCGLSPRVYGWIRSVTTIDDVRPAGNFARPLFQLASERGWTRLGMLDAEALPYDLHQAIRAGGLEVIDVDSAPIYRPAEDANELSMRRKALALARAALGEELAGKADAVDHQLVGRLERKLRRGGAEDLIILISNGAAPPAPAQGGALGEIYSVSLALEYRGHWVRLSRPRASRKELEACRKEFADVLGKTVGAVCDRASVPAALENLGGSYPYESMNETELGPGSLFAMHLDLNIDGRRFFYGDTCHYGATGPEVL